MAGPLLYVSFGCTCRAAFVSPVRTRPRAVRRPYPGALGGMLYRCRDVGSAPGRGPGRGGGDGAGQLPGVLRRRPRERLGGLRCPRQVCGVGSGAVGRVLRAGSRPRGRRPRSRRPSRGARPTRGAPERRRAVECGGAACGSGSSRGRGGALAFAPEPGVGTVRPADAAGQRGSRSDALRRAPCGCRRRLEECAAIRAATLRLTGSRRRARRRRARGDSDQAQAVRITKIGFGRAARVQTVDQRRTPGRVGQHVHARASGPRPARGGEGTAQRAGDARRRPSAARPASRSRSGPRVPVTPRPKGISAPSSATWSSASLTVTCSSRKPSEATAVARWTAWPSRRWREDRNSRSLGDQAPDHRGGEARPVTARRW